MRGNWYRVTRGNFVNKDSVHICIGQTAPCIHLSILEGLAAATAELIGTAGASEMHAATSG